MEEDNGVKAAPVTRLRRRVSVEQLDETKSPSVSAPSTPTKKRGGRLAAKPQLELIDENAIQNSPKRTTRKSIARDITEVENPVTPAARNTRVKSNTSLVSETEEKVLTPARRSTRIKSNTGIVLETTQSVTDSPRAKRAAARRTSQTGSDTEVSLTPARTTRIRKGSTSSIELEVTTNISETAATPGRTRRTKKGSTSSTETSGEVPQAEKPMSLIAEVITEEPEGIIHKSTSNAEQENVDSKDNSPSLRKSPRLKAKKERKTKGSKSDAQENVEESQETSENKEHNLDTQSTQNNIPNNEMVQDVTDSNEKNLSTASANLLKNLEPVPKYKKADKNKSDTEISEIRRHRTKSWTTLCATPVHEDNFYSDNESTKKKLKQGKLFNDKRLNVTGSGDGPQPIVVLENQEWEGVLNNSKKNRKSQQNSFIAESEIPNEIVNNESMMDESKTANVSNESNKENLLRVTPSQADSGSVELLFKNSPSSEITTIVFMADSDSNTETSEKQDKEKVIEQLDDQCVPVILNPSENQATSEPSVFAINTENQITSNTSCEPMDIDETMSENVSIIDGTRSRKSSLCIPEEEKENSKRTSSISENHNKSNSINESIKEKNDKEKQSCNSPLPQEEHQKKSKGKFSHSISETLDESIAVNNDNLSKTSRKSSINVQEDDSISKECTNISKRKSSISHDFEKSGNENKSTLVLSQIKDISTPEISVSKSPQINNELSKSINIETKGGLVNKNVTLNYLTSTPVQQKDVEKLNMQMNTSVITPTNVSKKEHIYNKSENFTSITSKSSANDSSNEEETEDSEDETSEGKNYLLMDEAEDAGDDYNSGDSQDEDERQYQIENEIVERGETLTSDEDFSNDSEYDKDSFIVSSDEEDHELLSGSEDDLGMSDNELTMSAKSKKKFNEKKNKQCKKASKEMYKARHGLNDSESCDSSEVGPKKKKNRIRLDSTLLESGDDNMVPPKKNKRMRLESTLDSSQDVPDIKDKTTKQNISATVEPEEYFHKKKKTNLLSESICNESTLNEKEITINNDNAHADDPLIIKVKPEPKTPQKELEISTIHFTHREEIEQVGIDENISMMKANETKDPLHGTIIYNDEDSDDDYSLNENEDIANNYDSLLKKLSKDCTKQIKTRDTSLSLEKKAKKPKVAILDELNLTEIKMQKNKLKGKQINEKTVKRMFKKLANTDNSSSDSVDLKLLFSDDSNGDKKNEGVEIVGDISEQIIPLKRTEGKLDIPGSKDDNADAEGELSFFTDTKGNLSNTEPESLNSGTKKMDKNNSLRFEPVYNVGLEDADSNEAPTEMSYVSEKSKKKSKKLIEKEHDTSISTTNESTAPKTPRSDKKKNNKLSNSQDTNITGELEMSTHSGESMEKSFGSKKKTKKVSESQEDSVCVELFPTISSASEKKKKRVKYGKDPITQATETIDETAIPHEEPLVEGNKKKRKRKSSGNNTDEGIDHPDNKPLDTNTSQKLNESSGNKKKKLKASKVLGSISDKKIEEVITDREIQGSMKSKKNIYTEQDPHLNANRKRKKREDDESDKNSKILKRNALDKIPVPRLPTNIINQLEDKPRKDVLEKKKAKFTSTTDFIVEETNTKRSKPSNFLEETVYLNDDDNTPVVKKKSNGKIPKVLPFLPTVSISDGGFTTNFQVNVISQKMEFVAQRNEVPNYKDIYLKERRIKKLRTYDLFKKNRKAKLSKF